MTKTLIMFLFSSQVDAYVNAITYTYDEMNIESVIMVYVQGTKTELNDEKASNLFTNIWRRIESLKNNAVIYEKINQKLLNRRLVSIEYSHLKSSLSQIIRSQGRSRNCIIDLTGATKVPSIDVFSVCLALGVKSIYTFELAKRPNFQAPNYSADNFLYDMLRTNDYSYTCLTSTDPVRASQASLLRKSSFLWYVGSFSLCIMIISLYLILTVGSENIVVQIANIGATIVGLVTPIIALAEQRNKEI